MAGTVGKAGWVSKSDYETEPLEDPPPAKAAEAAE
jgi:hypothetical protein